MKLTLSDDLSLVYLCVRKGNIGKKKIMPVFAIFSKISTRVC